MRLWKSIFIITMVALFSACGGGSNEDSVNNDNNNIAPSYSVDENNNTENSISDNVTSSHSGDESNNNESTLNNNDDENLSSIDDNSNSNTENTSNNSEESNTNQNSTADKTAPIITILGDNPVSIVQNKSYTDAGATANDNVDGNITSSIKVTSTVDTSTIGSYSVTYDANDSSGNQAVRVQRVVNVVAKNTTEISIKELKRILKDNSIPYTTEDEFNQSEYAKHHLPDNEAHRLEKAHMLVATATDPDTEWFTTYVDKSVVLTKAGEDYTVQLKKERVDGSIIGPVDNDKLRLVVRIQRDSDVFEEITGNNIEQYAKWTAQGELTIHIPDDLNQGRLLIGVRPNFDDEATNAIAERWSTVIIGEVWQTKTAVTTIDASSVIFPIDNEATKGFAPDSKFTKDDLTQKVNEQLQNHRLMLPIVIKDKNLQVGDLISYMFRGKPYSGKIFSIERRDNQQFALLTLKLFDIYNITRGTDNFIITQKLYPENVIFRENIKSNSAQSNKIYEHEKLSDYLSFESECAYGESVFTIKPIFSFKPMDAGFDVGIHTPNDNIDCTWRAYKSFQLPVRQLLVTTGFGGIMAYILGTEGKITPYGELFIKTSNTAQLGFVLGYSVRKGGHYHFQSPIGFIDSSNLALKTTAKGEGEIGGDLGLEITLNAISKNGLLASVSDALDWLFGNDDENKELAIGLTAKAGLKLALVLNSSNAREVYESGESSEFGLMGDVESEISPSETIMDLFESLNVEIEPIKFPSYSIFDKFKVKAEYTFNTTNDNGIGDANIQGLDLKSPLLKKFFSGTKGVLAPSNENSSVFNDSTDSITYDISECQSSANSVIISPVIACTGIMCGQVEKDVELCKPKLEISTKNNLSAKVGESSSKENVLQAENKGTDSANYKLEWTPTNQEISQYISFNPDSGTVEPKGIKAISATFECPNTPKTLQGEIGIRRIGGEIEGKTTVTLTCESTNDDCCGHTCAEGETPPPCGCPTSTSLPPKCCSANTENTCSSQGGDPHFSTFDRLAYDFQGVGEFILVKSTVPNDTFEVQSRYRPWGRRTDVSVAQAIAMRIDNDRVGYYRGMETPLLINGVPKNLEVGDSMTLPSGGKIIHINNKYRITATDGSTVDIRYGLTDMFILVSIPSSKRGQIIGLMGNANENTQDDVTMRDGTLLGTTPAFDTLYPAYADSWRISQEESLFDYREGETTETFTDRKFPRVQTRASNLPAHIRTQAEQICRTAGIVDSILLENCILDVALTGNNGFADIPTDTVIPTETLNITPPPTPTINTEGFGQFTGLVHDAITNQNLNSGEITLTIDGNPLSGNNTHSISMGRYETSIVPTGTSYQIDINVDGYISERISNLEVQDRYNLEIEPVKLIPIANNGEGSISGNIKNAVDNNSISNLNINIRRYINQRSGEILQSTTSDSNGLFTFDNLEAGNYTVEIQGEGYVTNYLTVTNIGGQTNQLNAIISPIIGDSQFRIVLSWDETPRDLDSHLTGPTEQDNRFHISYNNEGYSNLEIAPYAYLDRDDTSSFGPETITIGKLVRGDVYRYSIHNYSNRGSSSSQTLAQSNARVEVYGDGNRLISTFNVPNQEGTLWTVFEINEQGFVIPINNMSYETVNQMELARARNKFSKSSGKPIQTDYWDILFQSEKK